MVTAFRPSVIQIGAADPTPDAVLWQNTSVRANFGINVHKSGANNQDVTFAGAIGQNPIVSVETTQIKDFLDFCDPDSIAVDQCQIYAEELAHGGGGASGSAHFQTLIDQAHLIPRSLRAEQGSPAVLSFDIVGTYDGTNAPIQINADQALPTFPDPFTPQLWTVGPVFFNTTRIETRSVNIDFGITDEQLSRDGELYARKSVTTARAIMVEVETLNLETLSTVTADGLDQATVKVFFRKLTEQGAPVADATATHIGITLNDTYVSPGELGGSDGQTSTARFTIHPVNNGTDAYFTLDTTQAIA